MNKTEWIQTVSAKTMLPKDRAAKAVNEILSSISAALAKGDEVKINDFGTFQVTEKSERKGRNPQTGEEITISASKAAQFKAAKTLKDRVNGRDFISDFLEADKITETEAKVLSFIVEKTRKLNETNDNELAVVETMEIAEAAELEFKEAEQLVNRLIGKRILNTEVYTSQIDSVFLRANYRKLL
ncbi:HU family DNA-binding protein [Planococcus sp. YIM B11945]|uniref:HU family DNA-binding protein n=1 Tax=Planococcus sp. YIM B11945 TaxID=3435410 RepID=UPI003D7DBA4B